MELSQLCNINVLPLEPDYLNVSCIFWNLTDYLNVSKNKQTAEQTLETQAMFPENMKCSKYYADQLYSWFDEENVFIPKITNPIVNPFLAYALYLLLIITYIIKALQHWWYSNKNNKYKRKVQPIINPSISPPFFGIEFLQPILCIERVTMSRKFI